MRLVLTSAAVAVVMVAAACGCGGQAGAPDATSPMAAGDDTSVIAESTATPKAKASKTPEPKATKKPKKQKSAWSRRITQHHSNDATFNTDRRSPYFVPEDGRLKITWDVWPNQDEYNWAAVLFPKGEGPNNSLGVGPLLMWEADTPDSGSKTFRVKAGRQYYLWTELWHCDGDFIVSEHR